MTIRRATNYLLRVTLGEKFSKTVERTNALHGFLSFTKGNRARIETHIIGGEER